MDSIIPEERIENKIHVIRGKKVMIDRDLANLYMIETFNLNKAVRRNISRFPADFMFQLTREEYQALRFQVGMLRKGAHSKYLPYAFTEQGVAMLSSVLHSEKAINVNIMIMRAFIRLKQVLANHQELAEKFDLLTARLDGHETVILQMVEEIRKLTDPLPVNAIGFNPDR